jgi:hypothetical protein
MAQTPMRAPRRFATVALLTLGLAAAACTGDIAAPPSLEDGPRAGDDDDDDGSPDGVVMPGTGDRPSVGDPTTPDGVGWSTRFPKLSNRQWENTVQALLLLDAPTGFAKDFTQEPLDKGYEPLAAAELTISGDAWTRHQAAAEKVAQLIVADDAKLAKVAPPASGDLAARAAAFIAAFGRRAYRRPLTAEEQSAYVALFNKGPELVGGDAFKAGVRLVLEGMLQSAHFLYRVESAEKVNAERKVQLSGYEVATRLSYALWNSTPSDELLAAAAAGELDSKEGVARWAGKLLDDARAREVLLTFHEQTFQVASYGTQEKDASLGFNADTLAPLLKDEARRFFQYVVLEKSGGITQLLTDPVAFVNATTAPFYGLTGVTGTALQQKSLNPSERAGLLGQLGFLSKNATRSTSDPVHRGLLVLRQILCDEPDPPPMMFSLPTPMPGLTTREVYERATACGKGCHDTMINPPGFAFERFDAIGRFRTMEAGKPIDASGTLTVRDGFSLEEKQVNPKTQVSFDGPVELVTKLAALPRVHECYARNWMTYVLAHEVEEAERGASKLLGKTSLEQSSSRALLTRLVQLDTFRFRVSDSP